MKRRSKGRLSTPRVRTSVASTASGDVSWGGADDAILIDSDQENDIPDTQPVDGRILKGVVAYVEVRTKAENRSKGVSKQLELLGAQVSQKFTNDVTHVVWKDGKKSTREKAIKKGLSLVSVLWVDSCKQNQEHVAESLFPVNAPDDKDVVIIGKLKRMKSMQPKAVEEDIQNSTGRGVKRRRRRGPDSPAPLVLQPFVYATETQPMATPTLREKPPTPSLIPDTPASMKACLDLLDSIKKRNGSAHRRLSSTDSPNISPSTPLRQRLFQCFTEEADSLTESPSTSVKMHKSGPTKRRSVTRSMVKSKQGGTPTNGMLSSDGESSSSSVVGKPEKKEGSRRTRKRLCDQMSGDETDSSRNVGTDQHEMDVGTEGDIVGEDVTGNKSGAMEVNNSNVEVPPQKKRKLLSTVPKKYPFKDIKVKPAEVFQFPVVEKDGLGESSMKVSIQGRRRSSRFSKDKAEESTASSKDKSTSASQLSEVSAVSSQNGPSRLSVEEFKIKGNKSSRTRNKRKTDGKTRQRSTSSEESESGLSTSVSSMDATKDGQEQKNIGDNVPQDKKSYKSKKRKKVVIAAEENLPHHHKKKPTLVMTSMHTSDQEILMAVVNELGQFTITDTVCETTTHVVVGEIRRTLNVLSAIARGCWLVSMDWVCRSVEAGSWLPEQPFELCDHFPGAMISRLAHQAQEESESKDSAAQYDLFSECGPMYIALNSSPPRDRLVELVELCGGLVSKRVKDAKLCIGGGSKGQKGSAPVVAEKWILDCLSGFKQLPWKPYAVKKP